MTDGMQLPFTIHFKYVDILPRGPVQGMGGGGSQSLFLAIAHFCTKFWKGYKHCQQVHLNLMRFSIVCVNEAKYVHSSITVL